MVNGYTTLTGLSDKCCYINRMNDVSSRTVTTNITMKKLYVYATQIYLANLLPHHQDLPSTRHTSALIKPHN